MPKKKSNKEDFLLVSNLGHKILEIMALNYMNAWISLFVPLIDSGEMKRITKFNSKLRNFGNN